MPKPKKPPPVVDEIVETPKKKGKGKNKKGKDKKGGTSPTTSPVEDENKTGKIVYTFITKFYYSLEDRKQKCLSSMLMILTFNLL